MTKTTQSLIAALALVSASSHANELLLDLNSEAFQARFDATHSTNSIEYSGAALITDHKGNLASLGAWTQGQLGNNSAAKGGLGGKVYLVDGPGEDFSAIGLGGNLTYNIEGVEGLSASAELYYAPSMLISNEFDNFVDFSFRVNYQLFTNGAVYAGIRRLRAEPSEGKTTEIDDGLHIGFNLTL